MICLSWDCHAIRTSVPNTKYPGKIPVLWQTNVNLLLNFKKLFSVQDFYHHHRHHCMGYTSACCRSRQTLAVKDATLIAASIPQPTQQNAKSFLPSVSSFQTLTHTHTHTHTIPQRIRAEKEEWKKKNKQPNTCHINTTNTDNNKKYTRSKRIQFNLILLSCLFIEYNT